MANKKRQKYPVRNLKPRAYAHETGAFNVKSGTYDGTTSSDDFVVTGHSMGAANTEMEALSQQLSYDVGKIPDYPIEFTSHQGETDEYEGEGLGDLGGPEFYGNKPTLLQKRPIHFVNEARRLTLGTAAAALAGSAVLAGLAFALFRSAKASSKVVAAKPSKIAKGAKPVRAKAKGKRAKVASPVAANAKTKRGSRGASTSARAQ